MKVFWREDLLNEEEVKLLSYLGDAHAASCFRSNVSSNAVQEAGRGSGDYCKSIMAALCTMGNVHAPLLATVNILFMDAAMIEEGVKSGAPIPGWGSSFSKDGVDPLWTKVESQIRTMDEGMAKRIDEITAILHKHDKQIQPNPSCFTAAAGLILKMPIPLIPYLFVQSRIQAWSVLFYNALSKTE